MKNSSHVSREAARQNQCMMRRAGNPFGSCGIVDVATQSRVGLHIDNCDKCWNLGPSTDAAAAVRAEYIFTIQGRPVKPRTSISTWTTWPGSKPWPLGLNQWQGHPLPKKLRAFLGITWINLKQAWGANCDGTCGCWRPTYTIYAWVRSKLAGSRT